MALSWTLGALACHPDVMHKLEQVRMHNVWYRTAFHGCNVRHQRLGASYEPAIAVLGGAGTTSMALSWTLVALACHPDVMRRLDQVACTVCCRDICLLVCDLRHDEQVWFCCLWLALKRQALGSAGRWVPWHATLM
jgi:hypothetical protein